MPIQVDNNISSINKTKTIGFTVVNYIEIK
jgi:hypothetical protein